MASGEETWCIVQLTILHSPVDKDSFLNSLGNWRSKSVHTFSAGKEASASGKQLFANTKEFSTNLCSLVRACQAFNPILAAAPAQIEASQDFASHSKVMKKAHIRRT